MSHDKNLRNWETTEVDRWVYNKEETLKKSLAWYQKDFEVKKKKNKKTSFVKKKLMEMKEENIK